LSGLFQPRLEGEEGDDPRVAQLLGYIREALEMGVDPAAVASRLPDDLMHSLLLDFRAKAYRSPSALGYDMGEVSHILSQWVDVALAYATAVRTMIAAYEAAPEEQRQFLLMSIEYHWKLLRGFILNEVLPGHTSPMLDNLARREVDAFNVIVNALVSGDRLLTEQRARGWQQSPVDSAMITEAIVEAMAARVQCERRFAGGPPM
jgi:hypothetical protein